MSNIVMIVSPTPNGFTVCCDDPKHEAHLKTEGEAVDHALGQLSCLRAFAVRHVDRMKNGCLSVWCEESGKNNSAGLIYT
jgi:hypothetical protein